MHVNDHWITVAGVSPSCAHVYDSVYSTVEDDTKMQIAALLHIAEDCISLVVLKIQYQVGNSDCGLFAIAYATTLHMLMIQPATSMSKICFDINY